MFTIVNAVMLELYLLQQRSLICLCVELLQVSHCTTNRPTYAHIQINNAKIHNHEGTNIIYVHKTA